MIDLNTATRQTEIYFQPGMGFRRMSWASTVGSKSDPLTPIWPRKGSLDLDKRSGMKRAHRGMREIPGRCPGFRGQGWRLSEVLPQEGSSDEHCPAWSLT